jgi:hypothetical protein
MVRDVYAADDASPAVAGHGPVRAQYRVLIDLDPTGVSRVVHQFALSNLAPTEVHCVRVDADSIEVVALMEGLSVAVAEFIRRKLLQLTCVFEADCKIEPLDVAPKEIA